MIVYQNTKAGFLDDTFKRDIQDVVLAEFSKRTGRRVAKNEVQSWKESLLAVAKTINDNEIPDDAGVAIEYTIPPHGKRIDFMLSGRNADNRENIIIVELKQWSEAQATDRDAIVTTRFSGGQTQTNHPSYQAWSYASLLENFNEAIGEDKIRAIPCAYLHNYVDDGELSRPFYKYHVDRAPLFFKGDLERDRLSDFIKRHVKYGDNAELIYRIDNAQIRPSKGLVDSLLGLLGGNQEFVLIDDQKVVYEQALALVKDSRKKKQVLIVEGGPGTGKSVLAINLMVAITAQELIAKYVTKNAAPRAVFENKLVGSYRRTVISNLFSGSGAFTDGNAEEFDALIVDEAHRLNEKSGLYGNLGENQIKELISAAKYTVFFIDEDQIVTLKDIGRKKEIRRWAKQMGAVVRETTLSSQFRCNGSDGYLAWLDQTLQIRETATPILDTAEFDFRVMDSPDQLLNLILQKNQERNRARLVAGYCWDWRSKNSANEYDIVIPGTNFKMQWNLSKDGGLWISAPNSVEQIGCIHTSQGLEVDYIGVIVGPDMVVRDGNVVTQPQFRSKQDQTIKGYKKMMIADPQGTKLRLDAIIKNTYRTLMSRGMKGCFVYFTDVEMRDYVRVRLTNSDPSLDSSEKFESVDTLKNVLPFRRLNRDEVKPYINALPLVNLKFAAGHFGETQSLDLDEMEWVSAPTDVRPSIGLFIGQVIGESMNRRIPNGSWCLFRLNPVGSRNGKVVLAQHHRIDDADLGGRFTVKVYESAKRPTPDDPLGHVQIILKPDSVDPKYVPIIFTPEEADGLSIIAELVKVLFSNTSNMRINNNSSVSRLGPKAERESETRSGKLP